MEGKNLQFFISSAHREALITLSEYDTVENLKIEIDSHLDIPVAKQRIQGWAREPDGDDTILKMCSVTDNVNCLEVCDNNVDQKCDNSKMSFGAEEEEKYRELEMQASIDLIMNNPSMSIIRLKHCTLDMAIDFVCTQQLEERKILLLYLHNPASDFSKLLLNNIQNSDLVDVLNRSYFFLGWDISNATYHDALKRALERHVNLAPLASSITQQTSCALCIVPVADTISVFSSMRGKISLKELLNGLKKTEKEFKCEIENENLLYKIEDQTKTQNDFNYEEFQSLMADMLGDRDYDSFEYDEHEHLKEKLFYSLRGPPQKESGYDDKDKKIIEEIYQVILRESNQIAEFHDKIEISFIYNCTVPLPKEKIARSNKYADYKPNTDINPVPVYVLRKCKGSEEPCRVFIDHSGRVYDTWSDYLTKNKLFECEMILPLNGRYEVKDEKVLLEKHLSPACHLDTKILLAGDITSTGLGLVSGGIFIAAALPAVAVAPVALVVGGVVGAAAGVWAVGRSIQTLVDRSKHKETMSFANSEARGAYLNIVAGSLGFVGAGANMAVAQLATRGFNIGQGAGALVNTIGVLNIGAGGASLINSSYDVINQWVTENRAPSALTILQLSSSVLFFGHAVYNFKSVSVIVEESQARVLQDFQDSLRSNRHRKTFNKLMNETIRNKGCAVKGRAEVISAIRNIQNKDGVFAALTRNNKVMNKNGVKFSADSGQIKLNSVAVDMNEFMGLNKKQAESYLINLQDQSTFTDLVQPSTKFTDSVKSILTDIQVDASGANLENIVMYGQKLLAFCNSGIRKMVMEALHLVLKILAKPIEEILDKVLPKCERAMEILRLGMSFFSKKADELEYKYDLWKDSKDAHYYDPIFDYVNPEYATRIVKFFERAVLNSFSGRALTEFAIKEMTEYITTWISKKWYDYQKEQERKEKRVIHSAQNRLRSKVLCKVCEGCYYAPMKK